MKKICFLIVLFLSIIIIVKVNDQSQYVALDLKEDASGVILLMGDDFDEVELVLIGENHGVSINSKIEMFFIKLLKENYDLKYYVAEIPNSLAVLLNEYLTNGNDEIIQFLQNLSFVTEDMLNTWKNIYDLNSKYNENSKIKVIGIDLEYYPILSFVAISGLISDKSDIILRNEIDETIRLLETKEVSQTRILMLTNKLQSSIEVYYSDTNYHDDEGLFLINTILENLINSISIAKELEKNKNSIRDQMLYENFKLSYEFYPKGKMFGQWGLGHVFQKSSDKVKWIATNLEENLLENSIMSIALLYEGCESYWFEKKFGLNTANPEIYDYLENSNHLTIHKLDYENSMFSQKIIWPFNNENDMFTVPIPQYGVTTDYIQYIILIKDIR